MNSLSCQRPPSFSAAQSARCCTTRKPDASRHVRSAAAIGTGVMRSSGLLVSWKRLTRHVGSVSRQMSGGRWWRWSTFSVS